MTESERYDAVIIGDDLASVMTGALLAEEGLQVRLLSTSCPTNRKEVPLVGLFTSPTAKRVIEALDIGPALRSRVEGPPRGITIALPDRRFLLPPSDPDRRQILAAMFPKAPDALTTLLQAVEAQGAGLDPLLDGEGIMVADTYRGRRAWQRRLARYPLDSPSAVIPSPPLRQLIDAILAFMGHVPIEGDRLRPAALRAIWHAFHGVLTYRDGWPGFYRLFLDRMRQAGGVVTGRAPVESLVVKWRRARGAILADGTLVQGRVFLLGSELLLEHIWPAGPPVATAAVQYMRVGAPPPERPDGLQSPCGWAPALNLPACRVNVDEAGLEVRWLGGGAAPPVKTLSPLGTMVPEAPVSTLTTDIRRIDSHGLYRRPLTGPLKNLGVLGEWILPGLGLESACLTAWHGARFATQFGRRRGGSTNA